MSESVDNRVVEMRFENSQFEQGIEQSGRSLDKFKDKLNFKAASQGMDELEKSSSKVKLSGLSEAANTVAASFSKMEMVTASVINNVVTDCYQFGKRVTKALTIEPITSGFDEYQLKIKSIQTILANTSQKGSTLDDVNEALDEMNVYADQTIYNFAQMTDNMGKFTAAGLGLKESAVSIKGMLNLAGLAGATNEGAQRAMYQTSQALSAGVFKLMDWKSLTNSGMNVERFRESVMETARRVGVDIDGLIEKYGSFEQTLSEGWLTSGIFEETLAKMTGDFSKEEWMSVGYTEKQAEAIVALGKDAKEATTKVRTFTQLIDTMKESLGSGWTETWQLIVGDFEEATEFLTGLNDKFSAVVEASTKARNKIIKQWKKSGGRAALIDALTHSFEVLESILKPIKEAFNEVFEPLDGADLADKTKSLDKFIQSLKLTKDESTNLKAVAKALFTIVKTGLNIVKSLFSIVKPMGSTLRPIADAVLQVASAVANLVVQVLDALNQSGALKTLTNLLVSGFQNAANLITSIINYLTSADFATILEPLKSIFSMISSVAGFAIQGGKTIFSQLFGTDKGVVAELNAAAEGMKVATETAQVFGSAMQESANGLSSMKNAVTDVGAALSTKFSPAFEKIKTSLQGVSLYDVIGIIELGFIAKWLKKVNSSLSNLKEVFDGFGKLVSAATGVLNQFSKSMKQLTKSLRWSMTAETIKKLAVSVGIFAAAIVALALAYKNLGAEDMGNAVKTVGILMAEVAGLFVLLSALPINDKKLLGAALAMGTIGVAIGIMTASLFAISKIGSADDIAGSLIAVSALALTLAVVVAAVSESISNITGDLSNLKTADEIQKVLKKSASTLRNASLSMMTVAASILLMVRALKPLAELNSTGQLWPAIGAVGALAAIVLGVIAAISVLTKERKGTKFGDFGKADFDGVALTLTAFAAAMAAMLVPIVAIALMSSFNEEAFNKGFNSVIALIGAMTICLSILTLVNKSRLTEKFNKNGPVNKLADTSNMYSMAVLLGAFAAAVNAMVLPIINLGTMSVFNETAFDKGMIALLAMIGAMTGALAVLTLLNRSTLSDKLVTDIADMKGVAASIIAFASAMVLMVQALKMLTEVQSSEGFVNGAITGAVIWVGVIATMAALAKWGPQLTLTATGVTALAGSVFLLAAAMKILDSTGWGGIGAGIALFVAVCLGLGKVAPVVKASNEAFKGFSKTILKIGVGTVAFAAGLAILIALLALFGPAISTALKSLADLEEPIKEAAPIVADLLVYVLNECLKAIERYLPEILDSLGKMWDEILTFLAERIGWTPGALEAAINITALLALGAKIGFAIYEGYKAGELEAKLANGVASAVTNAGKNAAVTSAATSLGTSLCETIGAAFTTPFVSVLAGALTFAIPAAINRAFGGESKMEAIFGQGSWLNNIAASIATQADHSFIGGIGYLPDNVTGNYATGSVARQESDTGKIASQLKKQNKEVDAAQKEAEEQAAKNEARKHDWNVKTAKDDATEIKTIVEQALGSDEENYAEGSQKGGFLTEGFADGIVKFIGLIGEKAKLVPQTAVNTIVQTQQSHSPSKVAAELGAYFGEGYAEGLISNDVLTSVKEGSTTLVDTAEELVSSGMSTKQKSLSTIAYNVANKVMEQVSNGQLDAIKGKKILDTLVAAGEKAGITFDDATAQSIYNAGTTITEKTGIVMDDAVKAMDRTAEFYGLGESMAAALAQGLSDKLTSLLKNFSLADKNLATMVAGDVHGTEKREQIGTTRDAWWASLNEIADEIESGDISKEAATAALNALSEWEYANDKELYTIKEYQHKAEQLSSGASFDDVWSSIWGDNDSSLSPSSISTSTSTAKTAAEQRAEAYQKIIDKYQDALDSIDIDVNAADLEYQFWEAENTSADGKKEITTGYINEKYTKKRAKLLKDQENQQKRVAKLQEEYDEVVEAFGADSDEAKKINNEWQQEKIDYQNILNEIAQLPEDQKDEMVDAIEAQIDALEETYYDLMETIENMSTKSENMRTLAYRMMGSPSSDATDTAESALSSAISDMQSIKDDTESAISLQKKYNQMVQDYGKNSEEAQAYEEDLLELKMQNGEATEADINRYAELTKMEGWSTQQIEDYRDKLKEVYKTTVNLKNSELEEYAGKAFEIWENISTGRTNLDKLNAAQQNYNTLLENQPKWDDFKDQENGTELYNEAMKTYNQSLKDAENTRDSAQVSLSDWSNSIAEAIDAGPVETAVINTFAQGLGKAWPNVTATLKEKLKGIDISGWGLDTDLSNALMTAITNMDASSLVEYGINKIVSLMSDGSLGELFKTGIGKLLNAGSSDGLISQITTFLGGLLGGEGSILSSLGTMVTSGISSLIGGSGLLSTIGTAVSGVIASLGSIVPVVGIVIAAIMGIGAVLLLIFGGVENFCENVKIVFENLGILIQNIFIDVLNIIKGLLNGVIDIMTWWLQLLGVDVPKFEYTQRKEYKSLKTRSSSDTSTKTSNTGGSSWTEVYDADGVYVDGSELLNGVYGSLSSTKQDSTSRTLAEQIADPVTTTLTTTNTLLNDILTSVSGIEPSSPTVLVSNSSGSNITTSTRIQNYRGIHGAAGTAR